MAEDINFVGRYCIVTLEVKMNGAWICTLVTILRENLIFKAKRSNLSFISVPNPVANLAAVVSTDSVVASWIAPIGARSFATSLGVLGASRRKKRAIENRAISKVNWFLHIFYSFVFPTKLTRSMPREPSCLEKLELHVADVQRRRPNLSYCVIDY